MVGDSLPAVREVTVIPVGQEQRAMSIAEFDDQLALIKHVVAQMQEGVHYGIIPGTRDKSLWEPGAEYLRAAFRISWSYELTKEVENFETGDFRYEFRAFTVPPTQPAEWVASAWSKERKFWCSRDCPTGCDQKHPPKGMPIGDIPNNVKDRALKRAFVNLMRNVTGTSGWFKMALDTETGEVSNKYLCPIHNVEWFKRGKMKAYAHPIGDNKFEISSGRFQTRCNASYDFAGYSVDLGVGGNCENPAMPSGSYQRVVFVADERNWARTLRGPVSTDANPVDPPIPSYAGFMPICSVKVHDTGQGIAGSVGPIYDGDIKDLRPLVAATPYAYRVEGNTASLTSTWVKSVTFTNPFSTLISVSVTPQTAFPQAFGTRNRTVNGFDIYTYCSFTGSVDWMAIGF